MSKLIKVACTILMAAVSFAMVEPGDEVSITGLNGDVVCTIPVQGAQALRTTFRSRARAGGDLASLKLPLEYAIEIVPELEQCSKPDMDAAIVLNGEGFNLVEWLGFDMKLVSIHNSLPYVFRRSDLTTFTIRDGNHEDRPNLQLIVQIRDEKGPVVDLNDYEQSGTIKLRKLYSAIKQAYPDLNQAGWICLRAGRTIEIRSADHAYINIELVLQEGPINTRAKQLIRLTGSDWFTTLSLLSLLQQFLDLDMEPNPSQFVEMAYR